jgi:hypothetical protein
MPTINKTKITEFRPGLLGVNPKPAADIHSVYLFTVL